MHDLTVVFLTMNKTPLYWAGHQLRTLKEAIGSAPVISVSRQPMDFGFNLIDTDRPGYVNIYRQLLRAAKYATTKFIATAEDDCLYSASHFRDFRPEKNEFAYNRHRWSVFTWGEPLYSLRDRLSNCSLIAPRDLLIEALEERFKKYDGNPPEDLMGECGRNKLEKALGVTLRKQVDFFSRVGIVQVSHPAGTELRQQIQRKSHARVRAYNIPHWGEAGSIVTIFNGVKGAANE